MEKKYDAAVRVHPQEGFIKKVPPAEREALLGKWNRAKEDSKVVVNLWNFPVDVYAEGIGDTMPIRAFEFVHEKKQFSKELKDAIAVHAAKGLNLDFENEFHLVDAKHYYSLASAEFAAEKLADFFHDKGVKSVRIEGAVLPALTENPQTMDDFDDNSCVKKVAEVLAEKGFDVEIDLSRTYDNLKNARGPDKTIRLAQ